jgi:hypothetical protein
MIQECAWKLIVRIEIEKYNHNTESKMPRTPVFLPKGNACYRCDGMKTDCDKYLLRVG